MEIKIKRNYTYVYMYGTIHSDAIPTNRLHTSNKFSLFLRLNKVNWADDSRSLSTWVMGRGCIGQWVAPIKEGV